MPPGLAPAQSHRSHYRDAGTGVKVTKIEALPNEPNWIVDTEQAGGSGPHGPASAAAIPQPERAPTLLRPVQPVISQLEMIGWRPEYH